jgi:excisionase family DNA binding protein
VTEFALTVPPELFDAIVECAAELVLKRVGTLQPSTEPGPRYLYGAKKAAGYLNLPLGQVQKLTGAGAMPHRKLGGRNLYRTDELDQWLDGFFEGPPRGVPALRTVP